MNPNPYEPPASYANAPAARKKRIHPPPKTVAYAIRLFAASYISGIAILICKNIRIGKFGAGHHGFVIATSIMIFLLSVLEFLLLRGFHRGSKWAFWLFWLLLPVGITFAALGEYSRYYSSLPTNGIKLAYLLESTMHMIATTMFFMPATWRWFYPKSPQTEKGASV